MSEPVQLAKAAREKLAAALNALQTDDDVPNDLLEAAEPIAKAMSVLHRIERTNGANLEGRDGALAAVRTVLDSLQKISGEHPAVDIVMEAVAGSLAKVHALARYQPPAAAAPPIVAQPVIAVQAAPVAQPTPVAQLPPAQPVAAPAPVMAPAPVVAPAPAPVVHAAPVMAPAPVAQPPAAQPAPAVQFAQPPAVQPAPAVQFAQPPAVQPASAAQFGQSPAAHSANLQFAQPPSVQPAPSAQPAPAFQPVNRTMPVQPVAPAAAAQPAPPAARPAPQQGSNAATLQSAGRVAPAVKGQAGVDVELGIHSASNFYKGLGGNDVIEHGGIFVATYKVLKIGSQVTLRVLLPGDYEFTAQGVVQWTREGTSDPGFGARFTQITAEGRQLVYRYTRNREPMFYDDL